METQKFVLPKGLDLVIDPKTKWYMRVYGEIREECEKRIQKLYKAEQTIMMASGMNSIYFTLKAVLQHYFSPRNKHFSKKPTCLYSNELYGDFRKVLKQFMVEYPNVNYVKFKIDNTNDLRNKLKQYGKDLVWVFLESCSNPSCVMTDWNLFKPLKNTTVVVDNTFLSPFVFNPFEHGANIVVESCSKYLSKGKCIGGHTTFKNGWRSNPVAKLLGDLVRMAGIHVSPLHCLMITDGVKEIGKTMTTIFERTVEIVDFLEKSKYVDCVKYPKLDSHPSKKIFETYVKKLGPGTIWFHVTTSNSKLVKDKTWNPNFSKIIEKSKIKYETSFGKPHDLVDMWPKRDKKGIWIRLSVGYNEDKTTIKKLENILQQLQ